MSNGLMDNIDVAAESAALLPSMYLESPNVQGFVAALSTGFQNIDTTIVEWQNGSLIDTAEGVNLDRLGARVGQYRTNESDTDYRRKIVARSLANRSCGTCENMIDVMTTLLGQKLLQVFVTDYYPASANVTLVCATALTAQDVADVRLFILMTKPAGVGVSALWYTLADRVFAFAGFPVPPADGYDDGSGTVGGYWANYILPEA